MSIKVMIIDEQAEFRSLLMHHVTTHWPDAIISAYDPTEAGHLPEEFSGAGNDLNEITKPQIMFFIWIFWPSVAVQAKRWHDRNKSAWWIAIGLIPVVGPVWAFIENGFLPGDAGENRYGPAPTQVQ